MQRKNVLILLAALIVAGVVVSGIAISGTTYTWEETFEVTKPEVKCEIKISDWTLVGCPVRIWVRLTLADECNESYWWGFKDYWEDEFDDWKDECECGEHRYCRRARFGHWKDEFNDWNDGWEFREPLKCCCGINGTYSAHLYWWNATSEDWRHVMHLQEETNITISCWRYVETYTFIPKWEGEYKIEVLFTVDSETYNFTNED